MEITNQGYLNVNQMTIKMSGIEFITLWHKLREMDLNDLTDATLQFFNSDGEQFDLNIVIEDEND